MKMILRAKPKATMKMKPKTRQNPKKYPQAKSARS